MSNGSASASLTLKCLSHLFRVVVNTYIKQLLWMKIETERERKASRKRNRKREEESGCRNRDLEEDGDKRKRREEKSRGSSFTQYLHLNFIQSVSLLLIQSQSCVSVVTI